MFTIPNLMRPLAALAAHIPGIDQAKLRIAFSEHRRTRDGAALFRAIENYFTMEPSDARLELVQKWVAEEAPQLSQAVADDASRSRYQRSRGSGNGYGGY